MKSVFLFLSKVFWQTSIQCVSDGQNCDLTYVSSGNEWKITMDPVNKWFEMSENQMKPKRISSKKEWSDTVTGQLWLPHQRTKGACSRMNLGRWLLHRYATSTSQRACNESFMASFQVEKYIHLALLCLTGASLWHMSSWGINSGTLLTKTKTGHSISLA